MYIETADRRLVSTCMIYIIYVYIYIYIYTHTHTHTHIYIYIHTYVHATYINIISLRYRSLTYKTLRVTLTVCIQSLLEMALIKIISSNSYAPFGYSRILLSFHFFHNYHIPQVSSLYASPVCTHVFFFLSLTISPTLLHLTF